MKLTSKIALAVASKLHRGYWPILRAAARSDEALHDFRLPMREFPGHYLRADLREAVYASLFKWGCLKHHEWLNAVIREYVSAGDCVYDVGANIGYVSLLLAHQVGPTGTVHAFEPGKRAFGFLSRNIEGVQQIKAHPLGAGERQGTIGFHEEERLDLSWADQGAGSSTPDYQISVVSLDDFAAAHGNPRFVKIDVEGFEHPVFRGMQRILRDVRPVVVFEARTPEELATSREVLDEITGRRYQVTVAPGAKVNYLALPA